MAAYSDHVQAKISDLQPSKAKSFGHEIIAASWELLAFLTTFFRSIALTTHAVECKLSTYIAIIYLSKNDFSVSYEMDKLQLCTPRRLRFRKVVACLYFMI